MKQMRTKKARCFEVKIIVKRVNLIDVWKIIQNCLEHRVKQNQRKQLGNREREGKTHRGPICKPDL